MTKHHPPPPTLSEKTSPKKFGEGQGERYVTSAWSDLAKSQCLVELLRCLARMGIGLNEVEAFCSGLNIKFRSKVFKEKGSKATREVAAVVMKTKIADEVRKLDEFTRERDNKRRDIKLKYGPKSVTSKAIIKKLSQKAQWVRAEFREKYNIKALHLKKKHEQKSSPMAVAPADICEFANAKVYNSIDFDNIEVKEISVSLIGKVITKENEREVLKLHPKFAVRDFVDDEEIDFQGELGWAKLRYQLLK